MDITVIVALITALAAIVSPTVTAMVQRKSAFELKKIELIYAEKSICYKNYAEKFGALNENQFVDACNEFLSASYQAMLLCDHNSKIEIAALIGMLKDNSFGVSLETSEQFEKSLYYLYNDLSQSKNEKIK